MQTQHKYSLDLCIRHQITSDTPFPPNPPVKLFILLPNKSSSLARLTKLLRLPLSFFVLPLVLPRTPDPFCCGGLFFPLFKTVISNGLSSSAEDAVLVRR